MRKEPQLVLRFSRGYQLTHVLIPALFILVSGFLLVLSAVTDRPDLAVGYRWGAVVVAAIVIPATLAMARSVRRPALRATAEGVLLRNGRILEWDLFSEVFLVTIDGEEWMGFRFRHGVWKSLEPDSREIIGNQDGWLMAKLACAFPTESVTMERTEAIDRVVAISGLPWKQHGRKISYQ
jgi:hypothetical protein